MRNFWLLLPLITLATGISTSVPAQVECNEGDIALTNVHEGRGIVSGGLKLCTRGKWVTICHSDWELEDAVVACRQLNLSTTGESNVPHGYQNASHHLLAKSV